MGTRLSHGFVFVLDLGRMIAFYRDAFGMTPRPSSDPGFVRMDAVDGAGIALHLLPPHVRQHVHVTEPPRWRDDTAYKLCFETDDLDALRRAILASGGQAREPWTWEGTTFCECTDPEGNVVQIWSARAAARENLAR